MRLTHQTAKVFAFFLLIFTGIAAAPAQDTVFDLPAGTRIKVTMDSEVSSNVASVDDTFTTTVREPVSVRGVVVIPAGAVIEGRIVEVQQAAGGGKGGLMKVEFETLRLERGVTRKLDAGFARREKSASSATSILAVIGGTAAGAVVGGVFKSGLGALVGAGIGAGAGTGVALARKGRDARIATKEEFEIELRKPVSLPPTDY